MPCKEESAQWTEKDIPDLTGYVIIVTGGNSGIGWQTAFNLAKNGARVYIASRSKDRVDQAISEMNQAVVGNRLDLRFLQLDLQDLKACKASAQSFMQQEGRLDVLINNAGIMAVPYKLTKDGFESQFQVNYLAPFLFVSTLMPILLSTAVQSGRKDRVRVVNLSSDITSMVGPKTMLLDDVNMEKTTGMTALLQRYSHAKQASQRHASELNHRYSAQGLTAYSVHPGVIKSNLQGGDPSLFGKFQQLAMKVTPTLSPLEGSLNTLYCATSPDVPARGAGRYFVPSRKLEHRTDGWLDDRQGNAELWQWSESALARL